MKNMNISKVKKRNAIWLIVIGVLALVYALMLGSSALFSTTGGTVSFQQYGGDAYTGIQNAAAQTANNVVVTNKILGDIHDVISTGFSCVLCITGLVILNVGIYRLRKIKLSEHTRLEELEKIAEETQQNKDIA